MTLSFAVLAVAASLAAPPCRAAEPTSCATAGCVARLAAAVPAETPVAVARPGSKAARAAVVLVVEPSPGPDGPPEQTPGPVRFMVLLDALELDGSQVQLDAGTFDSIPLAVAEVERFTVFGLCVVRFPDEPDLTCYPPARQLRTLVQRVWY